jgi:hypothetical protein
MDARPWHKAIAIRSEHKNDFKKNLEIEDTGNQKRKVVSGTGNGSFQ